MQQPVAPVVELVRWQTATLVASAVAAVELVVLVVVGVMFVTGPGAEGVRAASRAAGASAPAPVKHDAGARERPRSRTSILVLNGNGVTGAAAAAAERVHGLGYRIGGVGNAERSDYSSSLVMYRRGRRSAAERLARDLRVQLVAPLDGIRAADLHGADVVLILGAE